MNLLERLERIRGLTFPNTKPGGRMEGEGISVDRVVNGSYHETPFGRCFVAERVFPLDYARGGFTLGSIFQIPREAFAFLGKDETLRKMDINRTLFLDTETTGLAGGTGTLAFLIGLGYFGENEFNIKQYFIGDFSEERAVLYHLNKFGQNFSALITFNGKAFDWPIIRDRFILSRMDLKMDIPFHLDLLFPVRRIWKERIRDCSLSSIESNVLGIRREGDIPGSLIPSLYFEYMNTKNPFPLKKVFEHNIRDILALVFITSKMGYMLTDPFGGFVTHNEDFYSLGRVFEEFQLYENCIACYKRVIKNTDNHQLKGESLKRLSFLFKRMGRMEDAVRIWEFLVKNRKVLDFNLYPYIELAKYYEHTRKDYNKAEELTVKALEIVRKKKALSRGVFGNSGNDKEIEALLYRLRRVRRKKENLAFRHHSL